LKLDSRGGEYQACSAQAIRKGGLE